MITPTIPDDVFKACAGVIVTDKAGQYALKSALLEYDKRVCEPLREELIFNEQRNIEGWRAMKEEKQQEIERIKKECDAALARVKELENEDPRDSHHCACRFSDEDRRLLQECDTHNLLRVSHYLLQKNKANYDVWLNEERVARSAAIERLKEIEGDARRYQWIKNRGGYVSHSDPKKCEELIDEEMQK